MIIITSLPKKVQMKKFFVAIFNICVYNKALRSYIFIHMLAIAGQTAGPNFYFLFFS